jgi:hypothetical protein
MQWTKPGAPTALAMVGLFAAATPLAACSDKAADDGSGVAETSDASPLYVVSTTVFGPESDVTYLLTVPSLEAEVAPDYDEAVAVDGFAALFGEHGSSSVYVGSGESPEITEWTLGSDGKLRRGAVLSFANYGLANAGNYPLHVRFAAKNKAYFLDTAEGRLLLWNPEQMSVIGEIALPIDAREGFSFNFGEAMILREDGTLLIAVGWFNSDTQEGVDSVQLIAVDTATDEIVSTDTTDACGDAYSTSLATNGTAYFSGYSSSGRVRQLLGEPYGAIPCQLRVVPSGGSWDDGYSVDLTSLTGGLAAGEFLLIDDETALIRVFDDSTLPPFAEGDDITGTWTAPTIPGGPGT